MDCCPGVFVLFALPIGKVLGQTFGGYMQFIFTGRNRLSHMVVKIIPFHIQRDAERCSLLKTCCKIIVKVGSIMSNFLSIANTNMVFIICLVPVLFVLVQSVIFISVGMKRTKELGIESGKAKKVVSNSMISSILPSLPIIISLAAIMPSLGKYVPWLRLSVIGSAMYETMCADMTITSLGYGGLGDTSITASVFVSIVWVMCTVSIVWPLTNVIGLKAYESKIKKMQRSGGFMTLAVPALFVGLMAVMAFARLFNFNNVNSILVLIVASVAVVLLDFISKKTNIKALSDFSFPLSMVLGMASAVIVA
jgi:hypothetical protein